MSGLFLVPKGSMFSHGAVIALAGLFVAVHRWPFAYSKGPLWEAQV